MAAPLGLRGGVVGGVVSETALGRVVHVWDVLLAVDQSRVGVEGVCCCRFVVVVCLHALELHWIRLLVWNDIIVQFQLRFATSHEQNSTDHDHNHQQDQNDWNDYSNYYDKSWVTVRGLRCGGI